MTLEAILCDEHVAISRDFEQSALQESWSWRNVHTARELSVALIDEKGALDREALGRAIAILEAKRFSLLPEMHHDAPRMEHLLRILHHFHSENAFWKALKAIHAPAPDAGAALLIRDTLLLDTREKVTEVHARRAVLSALLTDLRQNVGSCFATAPAILIQHEQPLKFLEDMRELLATDRLTRVFEGVESTVPLALNWGVGDLYRPIAFVSEEDLARSPGLNAAKVEQIEALPAPFTADALIRHYYSQRHESQYEQAKKAFVGLTDNALLKGWEFTLASLSESKAEFAKWNLYASLGVRHDEPHGIGEGIYSRIQEMLERMQGELEGLQSRYDHLVAHVQSLQGRLKRAQTTGEVEWLRADYRMNRQELDRVQIEYDEIQGKGKRLANLLPVMVDFYGGKIRDYFQEVYDAGMHEVTINAYDDSPAGFRLLYKHGRSNPATWTMIYSGEEYLQYLGAFFNVTELELSQLPETEGLEREISELVTECMTIIKRPEFLESSLKRLARAYNEPMTGKRRPWAYISGGTMQTLVSHYYGLGRFPKEAKRWVESPTELLAFYIDTLKELPYAIQKRFREQKEASMLAFSPTHAFACKPGWKQLRAAWENKLYTYTWIRDQWHHPQLNFLDDNILDQRMLRHLVEKLLIHIPPGYRPLVGGLLDSFPLPMRSDEFRAYVVKTLAYEKWLTPQMQLMLEEQLDALLYECLPLFPEHELKTRLNTLLEEVEPSAVPLLESVDPGRYRIYTARDLRDFAKKLIAEVHGSTRASIAYHEQLTEAMQHHKLGYPAPILVGDTNWVKNVFGFTVNPGTAEIDFWRFDVNGSEGRPISIWRRYLNGRDKQEWGLYLDPSEYSVEVY